ncbi:MAG: hypothetical protein JKY56_12910 [Kofleriaceae bacterium]|nr:hypothetical protein [Kofleriaceae bacterium]
MGAKPKRGRPRLLENELSRWIDDNLAEGDDGKAPRDRFAALVGIARSGVDRLCGSQGGPSLKMAAKIAAATNDAVPVQFWVTDGE